MKTYSLHEVADMVLPQEWKDPVRWLKRRLQTGEIRGYRLSRAAWRMTEGDVEDLIERHRITAADTPRAVEPAPEPTTEPPISIIDGLSERSRRRIQRLQAEERLEGDARDLS
jgi:hypothetical protein